MADVTVKHIDDLDSHEGRGTFMFARKGLGVTSFGMNVERWPPGTRTTRITTTRRTGRKRSTSSWKARSPSRRAMTRSSSGQGTFARVGPGQKRKLVPGDDGVTLLALGGKPGAFEANV